MDMSAAFERYDRKGKKCIKVFGVDHGSYLEIVKETEFGILCRRPGYRGWCGRGDTKYYSPEFIVYKKLKNDELENCLGESFEYNRKTKKEAFKKAVKAFEKLGK